MPYAYTCTCDNQQVQVFDNLLLQSSYFIKIISNFAYILLVSLSFQEYGNIKKHWKWDDYVQEVVESPILKDYYNNPDTTPAQQDVVESPILKDYYN